MSKTYNNPPRTFLGAGAPRGRDPFAAPDVCAALMGGLTFSTSNDGSSPVSYRSGLVQIAAASPVIVEVSADEIDAAVVGAWGSEDDERPLPYALVLDLGVQFDWTTIRVDTDTAARDTIAKVLALGFNTWDGVNDGELVIPVGEMWLTGKTGLVIDVDSDITTGKYRLMVR